MKIYLLALSIALASLAGVPPHEPLDAWLTSHRLGSYTKSFESEGQCRYPSSWSFPSLRPPGCGPPSPFLSSSYAPSP